MDFFEAQPSDINCAGFYPYGQQDFVSTDNPRPQHEAISHDRYIAVSVVEIANLYSEYAPCRNEQKLPTVGRVTLVDYRGDTILDTYVYLTSVEDYQTRENDFNCPQSFDEVRQLVGALIQNKILVGHRIWKFLSAMGLSHRALDTRDFALYRPFRKKIKSRSVVELHTLVQLFLGRDLLGVDSVERSLAAMDLFRCCMEVFEEVVASGGWPCDLPPSAFAAHYC